MDRADGGTSGPVDRDQWTRAHGVTSGRAQGPGPVDQGPMAPGPVGPGGCRQAADFRVVWGAEPPQTNLHVLSEGTVLQLVLLSARKFCYILHLCLLNVRNHHHVLHLVILSV